MTRKILAICSLVLAMCAAQEKPAIRRKPLSLIINGRKMTAEESERWSSPLPKQVQQAFINDPQQFLKEYAWYEDAGDVGY